MAGRDIDSNPDHDKNTPATQGDTEQSQFGEASRSVAAQASREQYFQRIVEGKQRPVVIVTGMPGAGKTTVMEQLEARPELNLKPAERLIPRPFRAGDLRTEHHWSKEDQADPRKWQTIVFGHEPLNTGWYAFSGGELVRDLKDGQRVRDGKREPEPSGVIMQMGHPIDITTTYEAVRRVRPLNPIVILRIDCPEEILKARLMGRAESKPGEIEERTDAIRSKLDRDLAQIPLCERAYGFNNLLNLSSLEIETHKEFIESSIYNHRLLKPLLENSNLEAIVGHFVDEAKAQSAIIAEDVLERRLLSDYELEFVPACVTDVLENHFLPAAKANGLEPLITSGFAAVLYGSPREVSPDIDFMATLPSESDLAIERAGVAMLETLKNFGGEQLTVAPYANPKTPCIGVRTHATGTKDPETEVELDGMLVCRFRPYEQGFTYDFRVDSHDRFHQRTIVTPNGSEVGMVPPEHVLFYKLIGARGVEQGKVDLLDAGAIIANVPLDPAKIRDLIDRQHFLASRGGPENKIVPDEQIDGSEIVEVVEAIGSEYGLNNVLDRVGCEHEGVRSAIREWWRQFDQDVEDLSVGPERALLSRLTVLKQGALVSHLLKSLDRVWEERDTPTPDGLGGTVKLTDYYGESELSERIDSLRALFEMYGCHEIGNRNIREFVNRGLSTDGYPVG